MKTLRTTPQRLAGALSHSMVHALGRTRSACGGVDDSEDNTLKRFSVLTYGVTCYASFLGALLYLSGFLNGFLVPKGIDDGEPGTFGSAMAVMCEKSINAFQAACRR